MATQLIPFYFQSAFLNRARSSSYFKRFSILRYSSPTISVTSLSTMIFVVFSTLSSLPACYFRCVEFPIQNTQTQTPSSIQEKENIQLRLDPVNDFKDSSATTKINNFV